MLFTLGGCRA